MKLISSKIKTCRQSENSSPDVRAYYGPFEGNFGRIDSKRSVFFFVKNESILFHEKPGSVFFVPARVGRV